MKDGPKGRGGTPASAALRDAGIDFTVHEYQVRESDLSYGEAVALELGFPSDQVFKTLVAIVDTQPVVGIVPVAGSLSLKELAAAVGGKRGELADPGDAQRFTGYVVGGISPFGQKRRLATVLDEGAMRHATILVSGGRRGLQLELAPSDLVTVTGARLAVIKG